MPYSSYNAYIVLNNAAILLVIMLLNYLAHAFRILSSLLSFTIVIFTEWLIVALCTYNIGYACRDVIIPFYSKLNIPYKQYLFTPGPILDATMKILAFIRSEFTKPTVTTPTPVQTNQVKEPVDAKDSAKHFVSLFSSSSKLPENNFQSMFVNKPTEPKANEIAGVKSFFVTEPNSLFTTKLSENKSKINDQDIATAGLKQLFSNEQPSMFAPKTSNTAAANTTPTPKFKYVPCVKPPLKPSTHRERLLWFLSPTPEIIEDFRIEQMLEYQRYWHTFNDRRSRVHYDKLTQILLSKLFIPLSKSIDEYNNFLAAKKYNVSNCSPRTVALSMTVPHIGTPFTLAEVISFITLEKYQSDEAKGYVVERIKELSSGNRMAAFRFTPKYPGMPTDADIIMHCFSYYLGLKEPYAIPPLFPYEGDVFKFLLIYIKITPELESWNLFEEK